MVRNDEIEWMSGTMARLESLFCFTHEKWLRFY
jgi:hypothetical protein